MHVAVVRVQGVRLEPVPPSEGAGAPVLSDRALRDAGVWARLLEGSGGGGGRAVAWVRRDALRGVLAGASAAALSVGPGSAAAVPLLPNVHEERGPGREREQDDKDGALVPPESASAVALARLDALVAAAPSAPREAVAAPLMDEARRRWRSSEALAPAEAERPSPEEEALHRAARAGDADAVRDALDALGGPPNRVDAPWPGHGGTPLHAAAEAGCEASVRALLLAGADPSSRSLNGATPLHWAAGAGSVACCDALMDAGAAPSATTSTWRSTVFGKASGQTPAHWAAESGHADVLRALADRCHASVVHVDERDQTPLGLAKAEVHSSAAAELERMAADEFVCVEVRGGATAARAVLV